MRERSTIYSFIEKANAIHNHYYNYDKVVYQTIEIPVVIICPVHGDFEQTPRSHLIHKRGCYYCKRAPHIIDRTHTIAQFIDQANQIHSNKYDYSKVAYTTAMTKVELICLIHGSFFQTPNNHTSMKQGCPKCYSESKKGKGIGGYSIQYFETFPERKDLSALIYVVKIQHETDKFIKIGITTRTVQQRLSVSGVGKKKYELLFSKPLSLFDAFNLEQKVLEQLKPQQYWPNHTLVGNTECIKDNLENLNTVLELLQ